jgi:putative SOS response-associated peptidase YedK
MVLDDSQFEDWMRSTRDHAAQMMKPYAGEIEAREVRPDVGNVRNNRPELMGLGGVALSLQRPLCLQNRTLV